MANEFPASPGPTAPAMVEQRGSPMFMFIAFAAIVIATLAFFNALGETMGLILAVVGILVALLAMVQLVLPKERDSGAVITVLLAVGAIVLSGIRLSGTSVQGKSLPPDDPRSTTMQS